MPPSVRTMALTTCTMIMVFSEKMKVAGAQARKFLLHAVAEECRGRGIAKFLWSRACEELFACGHEQLQSSVSAANLAVVNLYSSLGFRFREVSDVYHRFTL